jgi:hypothetical protein
MDNPPETIAVDVALLSQKLDQLLIGVADVRSGVADIERRVRAVENDTIRLQEQIKTGDRDSKTIAAVAGIAAAAVGRMQLP